MPSPAESQPQQNAPSQLQGALHLESRNGGPNGDVPGAHAGSVEAGALGLSDPVPKSRTRDVIGEGKQKARAVLAASGVTLDSPSLADSAQVRPKSPSPPNRTTNGAPKSRKRSRSGSRIPPRHESSELPSRTRQIADQVKLEKYVYSDGFHAAALKQQSVAQEVWIGRKREELDYYTEHRQERMMNPAAFFGAGYAGYGNGYTETKGRGLQVLYPTQRKRPGGRKTPELRIPRKERSIQADQIEELVPVRLDIEWEKIKLRDTFTWNLHDRVVMPEHFAEQLVEDFKLPPESCGQLVHQVSQSLSEQIQDFYPQVFIDEEALDPHLPYYAYKDDEMRILIRLNIAIGPHTLVDQFEWEINNPLNSPEEFAKQTARDLSLSGEFTTAIAHCIREQSQLFTKSLYITGHPFDGRPVEDADLKAGFLPSPLPSPFRPYQAAKDFTPYLYELNEAELDRNEVSLSREQRRQKRSVNRRGGPALPDLKDRQRTVRTLVVSSVLPGAAETLEDSRIFKRSGGTSGRGRRATTSQRDGADNSDDSRSEDSSPDSPAIPAHLLSGTARTRGMRGAATAAQAAMRANFGRSATPEASLLHHHETRTSARRIGGRDYREESTDDSGTLIVKLRLPRDRFRQYMRERKARPRPPEQHGSYMSNPYNTLQRSQSTTSGQGTPAPGLMGPPPSTPGAQQHPPAPNGAFQPLPGTTPVNNRALQYGRVDALYPPGPGNPPVREPSLPLHRAHSARTPSCKLPLTPPPPPTTQPPPPYWLTTSLGALQARYPRDSFEPTMKHTAVDIFTDAPARDPVDPTGPPPPNIKFQYLPRLRCHDCPGKLYTPGPGMSVENFEVHLKNRVHRAKVEERVRRGF